MFRVTAGLPSTAEPLGGWEQPANELRGHFTGHYLSACALLQAALGDAEVEGAGRRSWWRSSRSARPRSGSGYLSGVPGGVLRPPAPRASTCGRPSTPCTRSWPACSTCTRLAGNAQALVLLKGMAGWIAPLRDAPGRGPHGPHPRARVRGHERGALRPGSGDGRCVLSTSWRTSSTTSASSRRWRRAATS